MWAQSHKKGRNVTNKAWNHQGRHGSLIDGSKKALQEPSTEQSPDIAQISQLQWPPLDPPTAEFIDEDIFPSDYDELNSFSSEISKDWQFFGQDPYAVWDGSTIQDPLCVLKDKVSPRQALLEFDSPTIEQYSTFSRPYSFEEFCLPAAQDYKISTNFNNSLISSSLIRLYHDVLEHNLSCWLTENTCPYLLQDVSHSRVKDCPEEGNTSTTYNRVYQRTMKLDKEALAAGVLHLGPAEDKAASKALHLAILAFSAQWAQGSQRAQEKSFPSFGCNNNASSTREEFDAVLQRQLWEKAKVSLDSAANLECYRVAYAEVIFALTQRTCGDDSNDSNDKDLFLYSSVASRLDSIIRRDGPPLYMERAARKIHILKCRIEAAVGAQPVSTGSNPQATHISQLKKENHGTLNLLHWLVVMFDTISSSMHERPLVISDEDIQFCPSNRSNEYSSSGHDLKQDTLGIQLFIRDNLCSPTYIPQWPCSYSEASDAVAQAAQVKVLLFRQISCLQRYIRQRKRKNEIDSLIQTAIQIHRFWQSTYGQFFLQLSACIDTVPQRIQNWFICIGAHWNLAVLMLADLLDEVHARHLAHELGITPDLKMLSYQLRRTGTEELASLANVATPTYEEQHHGRPQLSEFHHAVDVSRILAEPWTMMLIKAFTKAAINIIGDLDNPFDQSTKTRKWLQDCTKVLWFLGKKSFMAKEIAEVLNGVTQSFVCAPEEESQINWSEFWSGDMSMFA